MEVKLLRNFKLMNAFLVLFVFVCEILSSEVPRPRGVSLSRASLYPAEKDFTCFDGSKTIPFTQINDDYCDCPDASDEPGTSACPNGIFHCTNAGHKPQNLAASRVNDGICDCCDGADEYATGRTCQNNCIELGRSAREEAIRMAELIKAGKELRADLSQKGIQLKQEKEAKLNELQKNKEEATRLKVEKEALKKEVEDLENAALEYYRKLEEEAKKKKAEEEAAKNREEAVEKFHLFDSNQDGYVDIPELQARQSFDKDRNGEVSEEEAKSFLNNQEAVDLEAFVNDCWNSIKPYMMMDAGVFKPPNTDVEAEDMQEGEEHDEEGQEEEEEHEPEHQEEEEAHQEEEEEPARIPYDEETEKLVQKATQARNEYGEADRQLRDIENEIKNIQEYLEKDFGPEEEFASLQGQCFDFQDHEYIYKLCPFEKTSQQPKSGASETRLGTWGRWAGPEDNVFEVMMYERGQSCWNGPQRSTMVRIGCGGENKVTSVSEPSRCEYLFDFVTPAACREVSSDPNEDLHDEL